jgi:hypothetical protein
MELLVVIAIVFTTIGLLMPAILKVREASHQIDCACKLKQITLPCHTYHDQLGHLPPGLDSSPFPYPDYGRTYNSFGNTQWHLLPYIEEGGLWQDSMNSTNNNLGRAWAAPGANPATNHQASAWNGLNTNPPFGGNWGWSGSRYQYIAPMKVFICPSDPSTTSDGWSKNQIGVWGAGTYGFNYQVLGKPDPKGKASGWWQNWNGQLNLGMITDGTSKTVMFAEKYSACNGYYANAASQDDPRPTPGSSGGSLNQWWADLGSQWSPSIAVNWAGPNGTDAYTGPVPSAMFQVLPEWNAAGDATMPFCVQGLAQSPHAHVIHVSFCDGTVHRLSETISPAIWWAILTPNGRERFSTNDIPGF